MPENKPTYTHTGTPATIEAFRNLDCTKPFCTGEYVPPTPNQVKALIDFTGWSQRKVALIAGVSSNSKGSTAVRKWKTENGNETRAIPYAVWRQLLECAGVVTLEETLLALESV